MPYQRNFDKRIRAAVIGAGSHCIRNILPTMNYLPVELVAVCDIDEEMARRTAKQYGAKAYTNTAALYAGEPELEAVFIAVGPRQHPAMVIDALCAGKHVWVEKPVAVRAAQVSEMIAARGDNIAVVGFKKAFMPATLKAKEVIDSEKYGHPNSILAVYHMCMPTNGREILEKGETPNWLLNGVHPLAFMMAVGGPVDTVTTHINAAGYGAVMLGYKNGCTGTLHLASGPMPNIEYYAVYSDQWELSVRDTRVELRRGIPFAYSETHNYAPAGDVSGTVVWDTTNCLATLENKPEFTQGFFDEMNYFCGCVLENKQPDKGTLEMALDMMKVYEAALISDGTPVKI
ncbi:MAG: Gfo/Idh/MocA family oxidoreductase [Oscillospiraceae bacterium]|jgi:predicted dehydrogenase|nr:Gfo/Idh/MocA family oxidoreductase [Oscillospiraceae bacterium]